MTEHLVLLTVSLVLLTAGAESLVRGASSLALRLGVGSFFVGLTVVAFGTSTPELFASVVAAVGDHGQLAIGNVVGSNIFNIGVILGLTAVICPVPVHVLRVRAEVLVVIAVAFVPYLALLTGGALGPVVGGFLVAALGLYIARGYRSGRAEPQSDLARELQWEKRLPAAWSVLTVLAGLALLAGGAHLLVGSATELAQSFGASDLVIGLTVVAAGTSAPELVTSLVAALRRQSDIAMGNILGSNVFNLLGILGVTCLVHPQEVHRQVLRLDTPVMLGFSVALLPLLTTQARVSRAEGLLLAGAYCAYVYVLFVHAPAWFA